MNNRKAILFKSVFNRVNPQSICLDTFLREPSKAFEQLGIKDFVKRSEKIKSIEDKTQRNHEKKNFYPAVDLSPCNVLSVDIDGISGDTKLINSLVEKLEAIPECYACTETASGNLVGYFYYSCTPELFQHLYYKLYLELTLSLAVEIDYLPEINRLRYVSLGKTHFIKSEAKPLVKVLQVRKVPRLSPNENTGQVIWKSE
tara:strand:- start:149 stop:751 length:603 start_codon:yes stop_codon:yes gene_type:complete